MGVRFLVLILLLGEVACAGDPPYVAGFARFHKDSAVAKGKLLIGDLGCASCHDLGTLDSRISTKIAPDLRQVAGRCDPEYLSTYIADPHIAHSGTTMPDLMRGQDTESNSKDIVHYLVSRSNKVFRRDAIDRVAAKRGQELYHQVGCVACHVANPGEQDQNGFDATSRPFPALSAKYSVDGLRSFLRDPLHVRASGRMPNMQLNDREATDIANYLLRDVLIDGPVSFEVFTGNRRDLNDQGEQVPFRTGITDSLGLPNGMPRYRFTAKLSGEIRIETAGTYTMHWQSSGAIRWKVADELVADQVSAPGRDQLHSGSKQLKLPAGWHAFQLEYFEPRGARTLQVWWDGPGIDRRPIPSRALRHQPPSDEHIGSSSTWKSDEDAVSNGRKLFIGQGCVNCHHQGFDSTTLAGRKSIANTGNGCLSESPEVAPNFNLSQTQRQSIIAALKSSAGDAESKPNPNQLITQNLTRLNCFACHQRDQRGGIAENREPFFTCSEQDLGGEGRIPPTLTDVGDKLQLGWLTNVVENGASVRPYMNTRMPRFGAANVKDLAVHFIKADLSDASMQDPTDAIDLAKKIGRELTGKGKLQCISCHKFNGHDSAGLQAMDLVTTTKRLNRHWFHKYMLNPASLRPGTRMPQSWPGGESFFKDMLDGDTQRQIDSIWTYLRDGELAVNPEGLVPQNKELVVAGKAVIYRNKLWEAGFRGIAVGFPDHANLAFDAEHKRLALLWKHRFLNVTAHWSSQSMGRIRPAGSDVIKLPNAPPFAKLREPSGAWPNFDDQAAVAIQFRGYQLDPLDRPAFLYSLQSDKQITQVEDYSIGIRREDKFVIERTLTFDQAPTQSTALLLWDGALRKQSDTEFVCGEILRVRLRLPDGMTAHAVGGQQLRVVFDGVRNGKAVKLGVRYEW